MQIRILLGTELKKHFALGQRMLFTVYKPEVLWETELKGDGLGYLVEKIARQQHWNSGLWNEHYWLLLNFFQFHRL